MTKKYRIKNEAVEKAVRGLFKTQEDFESQLSFAVDNQKFDHFGFVVIQIAASQSVTKRACAVEILKSDIEVLKYDPKVWNCLALVKPPKLNEPYRVIYEDRRYLGWWYGHCFEFPEGFNSNKFNAEKILFKPWDDEEF